MALTRQVEASVGDAVEVSGRRVGDPGRTGEILEILGEDDHRHYRVRWEDGHETMLYPGEATTFRRKEPTVVPVAGELVEFLREAGVEFEVLPHRRTTTAAEEAAALGIMPQVVAKTLVLADESNARVRARCARWCPASVSRVTTRTTRRASTHPAMQSRAAPTGW